MLRRRVKADVTDIGAKPQRDNEGLNGAIQVHVIESVLIMPDSSRWVGYLVTDKPEAVISRIRLGPAHSRARPSPDGREHSDCVTYGRKAETGSAADDILAIGRVVIHVAFCGMRLAPAVFARGDILRLSKVGRALIKVLV